MQANGLSPFVRSQLRTFQFFWLENSPDDFAKCAEAFCKEMSTDLGQWQFFKDVDKCQRSLNQMGPNRHVVLVAAGRLLNEILDEVHSLLSLHSIYVFCSKPEKYAPWQLTHPKIRGVFTNPKEIKTSLCQSIRQGGFFRSTILATIEIISLPIVANVPAIPFLENHELKTFYQPNRSWSPWANDIWAIKLNCIGQGTIEIRQRQPIPFTVILSENLNICDDVQENRIIRLDVGSRKTELSMMKTVREPHQLSVRLFEGREQILQADDRSWHRYWLSFYGGSQKIQFGVGEVRPKFVTIEQSTDDEWTTWIKRVRYIHFELPGYTAQQVRESIEDNLEIRLGEEPVLFDPLPFVVSPSEFSPTRPSPHLGVFAPLLNKVCRQFHDDLTKFQLDDEQFPNLIATIDESLRFRSGWCYRFLRHKCSQLQDGRLDLLSIRIRVDRIGDRLLDYPCMMEIWPAGHHSSICTHPHGTSGLIRVLHGELSMKFFPSLALSSQPNRGFVQLFKVDQMIWMMPDLNQTYQIIHADIRAPCCIIIQALSHGMNSNGNTTIAPDVDYDQFKDRMKGETQCQ